MADDSKKNSRQAKPPNLGEVDAAMSMGSRILSLKDNQLLMSLLISAGAVGLGIFSWLREVMTWPYAILAGAAFLALIQAVRYYWYKAAVIRKQEERAQEAHFSIKHARKLGDELTKFATEALDEARRYKNDLPGIPADLTGYDGHQYERNNQEKTKSFVSNKYHGKCNAYIILLRSIGVPQDEDARFHVCADPLAMLHYLSFVGNLLSVGALQQAQAISRNDTWQLLAMSDRAA